VAIVSSTGESPRLDTISRLARLAQLTEAMLQQVVRTYGLTIAEQTVLTTLRWRGAPFRQSPSDLASVLLQSSGGVTATIHRLERGGLVERVTDPLDGRRRLVQLTPVGLDVESRVFADIEARTQHLLDRVPSHREEEVDRSVALLLALLEAETGRIDELDEGDCR
jgi:DNA-binding MarR family transcriptional regulator